MPKILKLVFKKTIALTIIAWFPSALFAQCATQISKKGQPLKLESIENYQYLRSGTGYFGIAFKMVTIKKTTGNKLYGSIKYTSPSATAGSGSMVFKLANNVNVSAKLKFIKTQKTDDKKSNTNVYEIDLTDANIADLQHNELQELAISFKGNACVNQTSPTISIAFQNL
jgi:hypothetical protein